MYMICPWLCNNDLDQHNKAVAAPMGWALAAMPPLLNLSYFCFKTKSYFFILKYDLNRITNCYGIKREFQCEW